MENPDNFGSIRAGILGTTMETPSGEDLEAHLKEKAFKCSQCEFAAVKVSNLRTHFRIHSGEKPFKCNQCDYASAQASN